MNLQIHDILSNPELLKDVSAETLQTWIKQYPYVPIFHLYSLKRNKNYTETDLHKTAFYINNREKLYFLLKQTESPVYQTRTSALPKSEQDIKTEYVAEKNAIETDKETAQIAEIPVSSVKAENEIFNSENAEEVNSITAENITAQIDEIPEIPKEKELLHSENIIQEEEIITANKSEEIIVTPQISEIIQAAEIKPLSIADQILAEIKLLKEERAKALQEAENKIETISQEILNKAASENETEKGIIETEKEFIPEIKTQETVFDSPSENKTEIKEVPEEIKEPVLNIPNPEKTLSIQDEIIARIQKIKEEREAKANSETEIKENSESTSLTEEPIEEITESDLPELIPEKTLSIQDEIIARLQQIKEERETRVNKEPEIKAGQDKISTDNEPVEEITEPEIPELIPEKTLSIQDEIIARIQKIKEEREAKEKSEIGLQEENVIPVKTEVTTEIPEPLDEIIEIDTPEETPLTSEVYNSSDIETEKEELQPVLKSEEKNIEVTFGEAYKQPLLVHIEPSAEEKKVFTDLVFETQKEDKTNQTVEKITETTFQTIKEEKEIPEIILDKALISENPVAEKEILEEIIETDLTEPQVSKLDEESIKEPHTFVEWLKLLDGNLQIQTTETPAEKEWIEIPQYEVMQTIANKKQIQEEEAKIFEPNFEEGEIDLFNEIDEEVTKSATESVSFKQDMMTETLAKIYTKQGKNDKALEIYNALSLKFPEKSSYFATLIKNLQK